MQEPRAFVIFTTRHFAPSALRFQRGALFPRALPRGYYISRRWRDEEPFLTVGLLPRYECEELFALRANPVATAPGTDYMTIYRSSALRSHLARFAPAS